MFRIGSPMERAPSRRSLARIDKIVWGYRLLGTRMEDLLAHKEVEDIPMEHLAKSMSVIIQKCWLKLSNSKRAFSWILR